MQNITVRRDGLSLADFGIDTATVVFFLAVECARVVQFSTIDAMLMGTTVLMMVILPYFLPSNRSYLGFGAWVVIRLLVVITGLSAGYALRQTAGTMIPESLNSVPMTFVILAGMISCFLQFYGLMKLRLAK